MNKINLIRFLEQAGWGSGDYTAERKEILDKVTRDEFFKDLQRLRNRVNKPASEWILRLIAKVV